MRTQAISITEPKKKTPIIAPALIGGTVGAAARYVVPTKAEMGSLINKEAVDTFVSNTATAARGSQRSILKYGGIGVVAGVAISAVTNFFKQKSRELPLEYTKYEVLEDTPADSAYAIMWYGEE